VRPGRLALLAVAGFGIAYAALLAGLAIGGQDVERFVRDPTTVTDVAPWVGMFSMLAVILWTLCVTVCALAGVVLTRRGDPRHRFFFATAALLGYLLLDDAYLLHDYMAPYVGIPERLVYVLVGVAAVAWTWFFREEIARLGLELFGLAAGAFAVSFMLDFAGAGVPAVEDWFKLVGLVALATWCCTAALAAVEGALPAGGSHPDLIRRS
jgi:hypothetical protein